MPGKCKFQEQWLHEDVYRLWLKHGKDVYTGFCSLCKKQIDVSHSGINALTCHMKGKKHASLENMLKSGKQLTLFSFNSNLGNRPSSFPDNNVNITNGSTCSITPTSSNSRPSSNLVSVEGSSSSRPNSSCRPMHASQLTSVVEANVSAVDHTSTNLSIKSSSMSSFLLNDTVTRSEILWSVYCVMTHTSSRSGGAATDLFPIMFPDSSIADKMKLHKDKIAYSVTYGLGPHFSNFVSSNARKSPFYALSVDESLNEISQKNQLDIMINYWDNQKNCVCTRYLHSMFLEKSTAVDLLDNITQCIGGKNLSLQNLIQLSTDGPHVNLKLIFDLKSHMKTSLESGKEILDIGTCSLHIVNLAYKTAHAKVGWKLNQFLRSIYRLFKNYPSRRAVYCQITGSSVFPKKFCSVRWTENSCVIRRALEIISHLKKYVKEIEGPPATENFSIVKDFLLNDHALEAKLHFSAMIAEELEEFLTYFQRNDPLLPFLHQEVFSLMKNLGNRFVKKSVMEACVTSAKLKRIELTDANLLPYNLIDVGFGARSCLKKMKELDCQLFQRDCKKFLIEIFKKLTEKSPLNKRFVLGATCINPSVMSNETLRTFRIKVAIEELVSHSQLSPAEGDIVMREYRKFTANALVQEKLKSYNWKKCRLDSFFCELFDLMKPEDSSVQLKSFVQMILICFHGNAAVERSFSFNKNFVIENLQEKSLVAQRAVHDHIHNLTGGLQSLDVTKSMIHDFRNASSRRIEDLKQKKLKESEEESARKRAAQEIKELKIKKQRLLEENREQLSLIESQLSSLSKKL